MNELIIIRGAMGAGKTTVCNALKEKWDVPVVIHDKLRQFHLDQDWSQYNLKEVKMTFENLVFIIQNYFKNNYHRVIVDFLYHDQAAQISALLPNASIKIITLTVNDNDELKKRVMNERDSGWKRADESVNINREINDSPLLEGETRIDTSRMSLDATIAAVEKTLSA